MKTTTHPAAGQAANPAPDASGKTESSNLAGLHRISRILGTLWGEPVKPAKRKRSGKAAKRPGFALEESLRYLAGAAIFWALFGSALYAFMVYATR